MRVHAFCHALAGVAQDTLDGSLVSSGVVEHRGTGMAALMRRVITISRGHDVIKACAEAVIGQSNAIIYSDERFAWLIHPGTEIGQRLAAYRYSPVAASLSLAVTDDKVTLLELDVTFLDGQKLARPHAAVTHHHDTHRPARQLSITVGQLVNTIELAGDKRLFGIFGNLFVYVNVAGYISRCRYDLILDRILVHEVHQLAAFFLRGIADIATAHATDYTLQVGYLQFYKRACVQLMAMLKGSLIVVGR